MRVLGIRLGDRPDCVRAWIDQGGRATPLCCDQSRAERHPAVSDGGAVLDHKHCGADERQAVVEPHRGVRSDDRGFGIDGSDVGHHSLDRGRVGAVHLVDDDNICLPQVRLARVVRELVSSAQWVDYHDQEVGPEKRKVVVASVPDDQVGLLLGAREDRGVVDAGVDDQTRFYRGLVLLALLQCRMSSVDVGERREPLHSHAL